MSLKHQRVVVERGPRSGLPIIVAVHSTALGTAIGGCRIATYPDWRDGLDDVLRLSSAMTQKAALAGLPHGGGKTVVALPAGAVLDRRAVLHDVGDVIENLGGIYATGPDVGTGPDDMMTIGERTGYVLCRTGDSSPGTAAGVVASMRAVVADRFGSPELSGRSFAVLGAGRVGSHVVRLLRSAGATVLTADVDPSRRTAMESVGATWTDPRSCLTAAVDVLVPAALGGVLTAGTVPTLRCAAVAGPANNQLATDDIADLLHERDILWAPDVVVSAGGIVHAIATELHHETPAQVTTRIEAIGDTLSGILSAARETSSTPAAAASRLADFLVGTPPTPLPATV
ncbi:Glu/Leu/Phe/Val dehydrogenase dimerization domain-containing protein [Actinoplanes derwentensis]|uniref:Leucine dehydrogenase n=1 Tax=Actinoplanes derwentensis TaxID=113562 RepID=A0A1H2DFG2_9ACTN|nr:Glu/Leu/Phe/Val dehydrogenase dimerization domain-containing protein [Actinoplanes derwentensis]GID84969.1 leucine dehydrogenase [Actinoplanes derwentensis]SDT81339.1 leucine dehydrogenase [Actinoplanes derwentensis]